VRRGRRRGQPRIELRQLPGAPGPPGQSNVAETIVAGDEDTVAAAVRAYAGAGATDVLVGLVGDDAEKARTVLTDLH
jgi:alkanesulfonate monooxygenase SsuD/methylene tetrahydromethanopterin reductase-like flavin-dependent oxidoreductase (luciferase family)